MELNDAIGITSESLLFLNKPEIYEFRHWHMAKQWFGIKSGEHWLITYSGKPWLTCNRKTAERMLREMEITFYGKQTSTR